VTEHNKKFVQPRVVHVLRVARMLSALSAMLHPFVVGSRGRRRDVDVVMTT
jgi:hypothetical protein